MNNIDWKYGTSMIHKRVNVIGTFISKFSAALRKCLFDNY